jgi:hypothetical protein
MVEGFVDQRLINKEYVFSEDIHEPDQDNHAFHSLEAVSFPELVKQSVRRYLGQVPGSSNWLQIDRDGLPICAKTYHNFFIGGSNPDYQSTGMRSHLDGNGTVLSAVVTLLRFYHGGLEDPAKEAGFEIPSDERLAREDEDRGFPVRARGSVNISKLRSMGEPTREFPAGNKDKDPEVKLRGDYTRSFSPLHNSLYVFPGGVAHHFVRNGAEGYARTSFVMFFLLKPTTVHRGIEVDTPHLVWAIWLRLRHASEFFLCPRCWLPFSCQFAVKRHRRNTAFCRQLGKCLCLCLCLSLSLSLSAPKPAAVSASASSWSLFLILCLHLRLHLRLCL